MHSRKETDVGMTEYISEHSGFQGVIKMRYQDFLVNEIDQDGNVVYLTDLSTNVSKEKKEETPPETDVSTKLNEDDKEKLNSLVDEKDGVKEVVIEVGDSKEERTDVHKAIRLLYPGLVSETINKDGVRVIKVMKSGNDPRSQKNRNTLPRKTFCKFVLCQQNVGTMDAIRSITSCLRLKNSRSFQYAGTKDKRAVTTQLVTAPYTPERLAGINKLKQNIRVGNFIYCKKPLRLGDLRGNHFTVLIRNVTGSKEDIDAAFRSFSNSGFINYFGMQRFGTTAVPTYELGIAIMKSNWQKVVELILSPRDGDKKPGLKECLEEYSSSGDAEAALNHLRFKNCIEGTLLSGLSKYGKTQLLQAITTINRNTRLMYVHSYQSYVWNRVVSKRIREYGLKPMEGDLVLASTYQSKITPKNAVSDDEPPSKRLCIEAENTQDSTKDKICGREEVKSIKCEDVELFTIHDIVLPLPGHDVTYPNNSLKSFYKEIMKSDGVDLDSDMVHEVKEYSLPGAYRHMVVRPSRVSYDTVQYNDYTIPLLPTDLDKLDKKEPLDEVKDGKFTALRVQFSLPTSCYATVALREILKMDMSVAAQTELNKEHNDCEDNT